MSIPSYEDHQRVLRLLKQAEQRAEAAEAQLAAWECEVGTEMPPDFKDWHENSELEHPLVTRLVLEVRRKDRQQAEARAARLAEALRGAWDRMDRARGLISRDGAQWAMLDTKLDRAALSEAAPEDAQPEKVVKGGEYGWTSLAGVPHYGRVTDVDSNVVYIECNYCHKQCCTEAS